MAISGSTAPAAQGGRRTRYAIVGTGGRHENVTAKPFWAPSRRHAELVGFCDVNEGRLRLTQGKAKAKSGGTIPIYLAKDFDRMVSETKPDVVIVTTVDVFHHQYIIRAMELGCGRHDRKSPSPTATRRSA